MFTNILIVIVTILQEKCFKLKKESFDVSIMYFALASITKVMFSSLRIKRSEKKNLAY